MGSEVQSPRTSFAYAIASFAKNFAPVAQNPEVQKATVHRLIDTVGCLRGAVDVEPVAEARAMAEAFSAVADSAVGSTLVGSPRRATVEAAAFVNGVAARYLDFNDIYLSKEAVHPSDNIPSALALAEAQGVSGKRLCTALSAGYEVHCRLADSVSTRRGRWDNVVLGAIAASVMAGIVLDLDVDRLSQAISIAATGNTALMETRVGTLSMWKAAAAAYASRAGVFAALAASCGLTGPALALDGTHGLFKQVTGEPEPNAFALPLNAFHLLDTHLKAFPSQYFTQTAVSAALELRDHVEISQIRKITVSTFEFGRVASADGPDKWNPQTRETADHSMPYCVAIALLDGKLTGAQFNDECLRRQDVRALLDVIAVEEDPKLTAVYPQKVPTRIVIERRDGTSVESLVEYPLGHSANPMSVEQLEAKFTSLCGPGSGRLFTDLSNVCDMDAASTTALLKRALTI